MSLLLDALKKAAEEKLASKDHANDVDSNTVVDRTEVTELAQPDVGVTQSTVIDDAGAMNHEMTQSTVIDDAGAMNHNDGLDYDATMVDYTGMPLENTSADNMDGQDLTSFDFEPVNNAGAGVDDTKAGQIKAPKEPTESGAITNLLAETDYNSGDIDTEPTVIGGAKEEGTLNLDEKDIDVTQILENETYEVPQTTQNAAAENSPTSLTDNFFKRGGYDASPTAASNIINIGNSSGVEQSKGRLYVLLGLVLIAGLGVLGLFAYQYYFDSTEVDYKLSYQQYRPKALFANEQQSNAAESVIIEDGAAIQDEIVVEQKDYVGFLDKEFNTIEDASIEKQEQEVAKSPVKKAVATKPAPKKVKQPKPIRIKKVQQESISNIVLKGYNAFIDGDITTAKKHYREVLGRQTNNRDARLGMAAIAVTEGDAGMARNIYAGLLKDNPSDAAALAGLTALGPVATNVDKQATLSSVKLMLEEQPESAQLHFALGNLYADESRWPEAQQAFFNAYSLDPENADYVYNLAVSLDNIGKQQAALPFYQQALIQNGLRQSNIPLAAVEARILTIKRQR